jgi:type IV fimbrial biogenesis protein FimT
MLRRSPSTSRPAQGFSLLELLVTLGLLAILASLAAPALAAVLVRRSLQHSAEALVADLRLARSEAVKRAATVAVCSSTDSQSCSGAAAWREGWIVFVDRDGNRRLDGGEQVLRVQQRLPGVVSVASLAPHNDKAVFSYHPTGWAKAASQTLLFQPRGSVTPPRVVCISSQGRPTLRPEGQSQCS